MGSEDREGELIVCAREGMKRRWRQEEMVAACGGGSRD